MIAHFGKTATAANESMRQAYVLLWGRACAESRLIRTVA